MTHAEMLRQESRGSARTPSPRPFFVIGASSSPWSQAGMFRITIIVSIRPPRTVT
jgi:hypothetical protein